MPSFSFGDVVFIIDEDLGVYAFRTGVIVETTPDPLVFVVAININGQVERVAVMIDQMKRLA